MFNDAFSFCTHLISQIDFIRYDHNRYFLRCGIRDHINPFSNIEKWSFIGCIIDKNNPIAPAKVRLSDTTKSWEKKTFLFPISDKHQIDSFTFLVPRCPIIEVRYFSHRLQFVYFENQHREWKWYSKRNDLCIAAWLVHFSPLLHRHRTLLWTSDWNEARWDERERAVIRLFTRK